MITCRFSAALLAGALALSGCGTGGGNPLAGLGLAPTSAVPETAKAISAAELAGGALRLKPPEDWCIEPRSLRNTARSSFALVAGCHELTGGKVGAASPQGYLTISVGPAQIAAPDPDALLRAALSDAPEAERSRDGAVVSAKIERDAKSPPGPVWRSAFVADRRPVMVTIHAPGNAPLSGNTGASLAKTISEELIAGSVVRDIATPAGEDADPGTTSLDAGNFFGRFLNGNNSR